MGRRGRRKSRKKRTKRENILFREFNSSLKTTTKFSFPSSSCQHLSFDHNLINTCKVTTKGGCFIYFAKNIQLSITIIPTTFRHHLMHPPNLFTSSNIFSFHLLLLQTPPPPTYPPPNPSSNLSSSQPLSLL